MDDAVFLDRVRDLLNALVRADVTVTGVRPVEGRPWPRVEVTLRFAGEAQDCAIHAPLAEDWRYASGYEEPREFARMLAREVDFADRRGLPDLPAPVARASAEEVAVRWEWLLERLALHGPVRREARGQLVVAQEDGTSFTVLVTPEQWARIAEPIDPESDDPQDFNQLHDAETYLVFYEDDLVWSTRPELPPIEWGGHLRRQFRAASAQGRTDIGWFA